MILSYGLWWYKVFQSYLGNLFKLGLASSPFSSLGWSLSLYSFTKIVKVRHTEAESRVFNLFADTKLWSHQISFKMADQQWPVCILIIIVIIFRSVISSDLYASLSLPRLAFGSRNSGGGDLRLWWWWRGRWRWWWSCWWCWDGGSEGWRPDITVFVTTCNNC